MATNTTKLNLPRPDASDNFNRAAYNGLIDAIDANVGAKLDAKIETSKAGAANGVATLGADGKVPATQLSISAPPDASTTQKGVVQLSNATDSTSEISAATSKAVKDAKDGLATQIGTLTSLNTAAKTSLVVATNEVNTKVGTLSSLNTTAKTNLVAAVNELFTSASDGKTQIASAITGKGVAASGSDTFPTLASKIGQITTGINGEAVRSAVANEVIAKGDRVTTEVFAKLPNPATTPINVTVGIDCSSDGTYTAVIYDSASSPVIYKKVNDVFTKLANVDTNPVGSARGIALSTDGMYMAVAHNSAPYISVYKNNSDTFTKLPNLSDLPTSSGSCCAFSPDGNFLVVGSSGSAGIFLYKRSGDNFVRTATISGVSINDVAFSSDSSTLIVGASNGSTSIFSYYTVSASGTLTAVSTTGVSHPSNTTGVTAVAISTDKQYIAICYSVTPFVSVYKITGGTFSPLTITNTSVTGAVVSAYFSADGNYLSIGFVTNGTGMSILSRSGDTFTKIANPTFPASNRVYGIVGTADSQYTFVSNWSSPYFIAYKKYGAVSKNAGVQIPGTAIGYAKTGGAVGSTISIGVLFE